MTRRYHEPITVVVKQGQLTAFTWRQRRYTVATVLGTWRLATRWWQPGALVDRHYHRVQTPDWQIFELYHDADSGAWMLDVCQD